ncbi:hypothetical protein LLG46_08000 [bacterium]|nr:hypothetical protein [bacterium]
MAPTAVGLAIIALAFTGPGHIVHRGRNYALAAIFVGIPASLIIWLDLGMSQNGTPVAYKSACQNNMKTLAIAIQLYAEDYDGTLPSSLLYGRSDRWNKKDFVNYAKKRGDAQAIRRSWPVLTDPYIKDHSAFWCPSDRAVSGGSKTCVSYYWKAAVDRAWYGGFKKLKDFPYPADQIILYERESWHYAPQSGLVEETIINCAYIDSHVKANAIKSSGYTSAEIPTEPLPKSGVGEPAWFNMPASALGKIDSLNPQAIKKGAFWNPKKWVDY